LLSALSGQEITVALAEGATEQRDMAAELEAMLRDGAPIAAKYFTKTATDSASPEDLQALTARMAKAAGVSDK
jgi:hypothetical protein